MPMPAAMHVRVPLKHAGRRSRETLPHKPQQPQAYQQSATCPLGPSTCMGGRSTSMPNVPRPRQRARLTASHCAPRHRSQAPVKRSVRTDGCLIIQDLTTQMETMSVGVGLQGGTRLQALWEHTAARILRHPRRPVLYPCTKLGSAQSLLPRMAIAQQAESFCSLIWRTSIPTPLLLASCYRMPA